MASGNQIRLASHVIGWKLPDRGLCGPPRSGNVGPPPARRQWAPGDEIRIKPVLIFYPNLINFMIYCHSRNSFHCFIKNINISNYWENVWFSESYRAVMKYGANDDDKKLRPFLTTCLQNFMMTGWEVTAWKHKKQANKPRNLGSHL